VLCCWPAVPATGYMLAPSVDELLLVRLCLDAPQDVCLQSLQRLIVHEAVVCLQSCCVWVTVRPTITCVAAVAVATLRGFLRPHELKTVCMPAVGQH
jgi:hypothetical protein